MKKTLQAKVMNLRRRLSAVGITSGMVAIIAILVVGNTYGQPGSTDYQTYESFNRLMSVCLAFQVSSLIAFYSFLHSNFSKSKQIAIKIVVIAWFGMALGTATEFWMFSDLPYEKNNMRDVAFGIFSISGLAVGIGLLWIGISNLRKRTFSWFYRTIFLLYLPIDIILFLGGQSVFLIPALFSMLIGMVTLKIQEAAQSGSFFS